VGTEAVPATLELVDTAESTVEPDAAVPSAPVPPDTGAVVEGPLLEIEESVSAEVHATAPTSKTAHPQFRQPLEAITSV
jgi:hypothetical protein